MKRFKTNLLIGLHATVVGLAIIGMKYLAGDYNLASAIIATIITMLISIGVAYLLDGTSYIVRKLIGGR